MSNPSAAKYLVDTLSKAGVKRIYGITGDSLNAIADEVHSNESLKWVHVRHEEVAAFAAGAEAHLTDELTVCAGSCGPGNLHLINGLYDCHRSRVPVLAIAAQIPTAELGSNYFQETNPEKLFEGCSHYCAVVQNADQLPRLLKIAVETAIEKQGVSVLIMAGDVAVKKVETAPFPITIRSRPKEILPSADRLREAADVLNAAEKVTILAGAGCKGSHAQLVQLAAKLKAPIVHAMRGKEFIEYDNPYDVGMTGLLGFSSGYFAMQDCDTLLMVGTDFPYRQFYPSVPKIQIDERGENIGRRAPVNVGIVGSVGTTLKALLPLLDEKTNGDHLTRAQSHYQKAREGLDELAVEGSIERAVHPQYLVKVLNEEASDDAVITCDVGTPTVWAARYLKMNGKRRLIGSFSHGSMANAMPQAIGAQLAFPEREAISLSGDGGFAMLMGDFLTLLQHDLPVKIVVFNNGSLGFVALEMKATGYVDSQTDLMNPNFAAMARAVGIKGIRVEDPHEVRSAVREALDHKGPVLLDVVVAKQELIMPPHIELEQVKGFGLFALKAVMSGRGSELIDLARTNLWR